MGTVCPATVDAATMDGLEQETVKVYENTYIMAPKDGAKFSQPAVEKMMKEICNEIQQKVKGMGYPRYKFIVQVTLGQNEGQCLRIASRCLWNHETDNVANASYMSPRIFGTAQCFGLYYE